MNKEKEHHNKLWSCLTSTQRIICRGMYKTSGDGNVEFMLDELFGHHNLTSDTEPEEMLMVERKDIQWRYALNDIILTNDHENKTALSIEALLYTIFGDKCLPDEEPETKSKEAKETQNLSLSDVQPAENKELIEAKELDLCDLLKGCEGAEIFLPDEGKCTIHKVTHTHVILTCGTRTIHLCDESLLITPTGFAYAYPSKESFLANPLNAKAAWMEWKEARKPKYVLQAELRLISNNGKTVEDYECVEMEVSNIDWTEVPEAVKEALQKFHE